jgi:putative endonuclease
MPSNWKQTLGAWGESVAAQYLIEHGFEILARNQHVSHAEIDLIARFDGMLVFVEVKTRSTDTYGTGAESIDERKLALIADAALQYMQQAEQEIPWRIDVIAISGSPRAAQPPQIDWYPNVAV